jgi:polysaccharide pyruvyl transferase WcaK-like protein
VRSITILGSFSGRNAGDAAILASTISNIRKLSPKTKFEVPTLNPDFISKNFDTTYVRPVSILPWKFSLKFLGIPTLSSIRRTDCSLITDAILFDVDLYNPIFNYLFGLAFLVAYAKRLGKPIFGLNCGVGPINTKDGERLLKYIGNNTKLMIVRDEYSRDLLKKVGVSKPSIIVSADSALTNESVETSRIEEIFYQNKIDTSKGLIGFNVTKYIDTWLAKSGQRLDKTSFQNIISDVVDRLVKDLDVDVVFVVTQPMDSNFVKEIINKVNNQTHIKIIGSNWEYTNHELMGILGGMDVFIGMRYHSLVLSSAMNVPIVGIAYTPKVISLLKQIGQPNRVIDMQDFDAEKLYNLAKNTWENRVQIRKEITPKIEELKAKALQSFTTFLHQESFRS